MITWIVVVSLAAYRITRFCIEDSMFDGTRLRLILWLKEKRSLLASKVLDLIECPYCLSVWACAGVVSVVDVLGFSVPLPGLVWLASCGGTMIVWMIVEGIREAVHILGESRDDH